MSEGINIELLFKKAESLYKKNELEESAAVYLELEPNPAVGALCRYRLAQISNKTNDPLTAYELFYSALERKPDLFSFVLPESHPNSKYVFKGMRKELELNNCQLCGAEGEPYWCYPLPEAVGYHSFFNPVRLWLFCENCNHLFSKYFPERLSIYDGIPKQVTTALFPIYSAILSNIKRYAKGTELLEVGVGACEFILAARESGYNVFGIDISREQIERARLRFGLNVEAHDFLEFEANQKWDVIVMGDVLEHVGDPVPAIKKAYEMLNTGGVLWISTPNFESAFSMTAGHDDPMRREAFHLNYFSRDSLYKLLKKYKFEPVEYNISRHYNGSMEIISVKT